MRTPKKATKKSALVGSMIEGAASGLALSTPASRSWGCRLADELLGKANAEGAVEALQQLGASEAIEGKITVEIAVERDLEPCSLAWLQLERQLTHDSEQMRAGGRSRASLYWVPIRQLVVEGITLHGISWPGPSGPAVSEV